MKFSGFFDDGSAFREIDDVKAAIKNSKNYKNESIDGAKALNFFKTSKQRSYLVVTDKMVYCIVDDVRKDSPRVNWSEKKEVFDPLVISTHPKTDKTGLVDFGDKHKNWLYTKANFINTEIASEVSSLLLPNDDT